MKGETGRLEVDGLAYKKLSETDTYFSVKDIFGSPDIPAAKGRDDASVFCGNGRIDAYKEY